MLIRATALALLIPALALADLVADVEQAAQRKDYARAEAYLRAYRSKAGETPESILALSWMGRWALDQSDFGKAEIYARDTYTRCLEQLKKRPLDREPDLPLALGAAIEVQGLSAALQGRRTEAVAYLNTELKKYAATSIRARIQKNINLLTLQGRPAPPLRGVTLPAGKPALIFFWAHWCPDCRSEIPVLARLKQEFGPRGLVFIGPTQKYGYVAGGQDAPPEVEVRYIEAVRKQLYSAVVDAPAIVNQDNFINYGVSTTPTLTLVDAKGIVRLYHPGAMPYAQLRAAIESVLAVR